MKAAQSTTLPSDADASGRAFGPEELSYLAEVMASGRLTSTGATQVRALEARFSALLGVRHAIACSSGTAALHAAVVGLDPEPGDEIVTTGITDMGAIAAILYQGAIPVFADVDPETANVTAGTVADRLSERTSAIVATHLFGNPCLMDELMALADSRGIPVIEDCSQAYLACTDGRLVGTVGAVGCFSMQQGKHLTAGEGGIVVTDDDALARRMRLAINKAWPYGESDPDHEFLALNYRMTELQGAVARAQLAKLPEGVARRIAMADRLTSGIEDLGGLKPPLVKSRDVHSYWRYCVRVDRTRIPGGPVAVARRLKGMNLAAAPRYIERPAFRCAVIAERRTFGTSGYPFTLARPEVLDYSDERFPGTFAALDSSLVLPWNERLTDEHVDRLCEALTVTAEDLGR